MFFDLVSMLTPQKIVFFVLVLSRLSGMMTTAPLLSTYPIPMPIKTGLIAMVAFLTYPLIAEICPLESIPTNLLALSIMIFKEVVVGAIIGFCMNIIFVAIQVAGQMISIQMGLAVSNVLDPVTHQQVPIIGQFYLFLAMILFLFINGHHYLFTSILDSYNLMPISVNFDIPTELVQNIIFFTSQIFVIAFRIIMPIYSLLLILTVLLGFTSKMMPQMNIFMVALPVKIYIGITLMSIFIAKTYSFLAITIRSLLNQIHTMFV